MRTQKKTTTRAREQIGIGGRLRAYVISIPIDDQLVAPLSLRSTA